MGYNGFFGKALTRNAKKKDFEVVEITKNNYSDLKSYTYDYLINCATPSAKYWASKNPFLDFKKTVELTADLVYNWNYLKLIQISTMSVNDISDNHPYGINKKAAEIISFYKNSLVVRLGSLYGEGLKKGPLFDLLNHKRVYVDIKSKYNLIDIDFCANWILNNLNRNGIVQLGATDTISLSEITERLGLEVKYEGDTETIFSKEIEKEMPSTKEVWNFIFNYIRK